MKNDKIINFSRYTVDGTSTCVLCETWHKTKDQIVKVSDFGHILI